MYDIMENEIKQENIIINIDNNTLKTILEKVEKIEKRLETIEEDIELINKTTKNMDCSIYNIDRNTSIISNIYSTISKPFTSIGELYYYYKNFDYERYYEYINLNRRLIKN